MYFDKFDNKSKMVDEEQEMLKYTSSELKTLHNCSV